MQELEALLGFPLRSSVPNTRPVRKTMEIARGSLEKYIKDLLGTQGTGGYRVHFGSCLQGEALGLLLTFLPQWKAPEAKQQ